MKDEVTAEVIGNGSDEMVDFLAKLFAPMVVEALEKVKKHEVPHNNLLRQGAPDNKASGIRK